MSTIRATYVQHGSSAVPNITLNASGQVIVASGIVSSGTFAAPSGTAAAPGIYFDGDSNTGLYSPGADQVAVATNSTGRLFIDASGRVSVGTSTNNVFDQVGTPRPLVVQSSDSSTTLNGSTNSITICNGDTTTNNTSQINFAAITGANTFQYSSAIISAIHGARVNGQYPAGTLIFSTSSATNNAPSEKLRITSAGLVGVGTSSPADTNSFGGVLDLSGSQGGALYVRNQTSASKYGVFGFYDTDIYVTTHATGNIRFNTGSAGTERARIDSSGRLLVGTFTSTGNATFSTAEFVKNTLSEIVIGRSDQPASSGDGIGRISFNSNAGNVWQTHAEILCQADAASGSGDKPGRLVFSTTADGASSPTERMRITSLGDVLFGTNAAPANSNVTGVAISGANGQFGGYIACCRDGSNALAVGRKNSDGELVQFFQDGTNEGTISVSGTTVSYNGAHLSRWSQLPSGQDRTEILRGSVLSNIDEMCEWGEEENEQLNRMKVSDVEGDKNVSGVFQAWDDDDDTYTNDFYCAMTGDFIIRIGAGVTVERGDLLMSAGDGTAKPQDDDIIRSKTIAKVTSTNVSCTYEDGSYCVPCVLMAC